MIIIFSYSTLSFLTKLLVKISIQKKTLKRKFDFEMLTIRIVMKLLRSIKLNPGNKLVQQSTTICYSFTILHRFTISKSFRCFQCVLPHVTRFRFIKQQIDKLSKCFVSAEIRTSKVRSMNDILCLSCKSVGSLFISLFYICVCISPTSSPVSIGYTG